MTNIRTLAMLYGLYAMGAHQMLAQRAPQSPTLMDDPADARRLGRSHVLSGLATHPNNATSVLPTGWAIGPAGSQIAVGTLPFASVFFNGAVLTVNGGDSGGAQSASVVDPTMGQTLETLSIQNVFPSAATGLGTDVLISGGFSNAVYEYDSNYNLVETYNLPGYAGGVAVVDATHFAATYSENAILGGVFRPGHVVLIDADTGATVSDQTLGPFEANSIYLASSKLYVTIPAEDKVAVFDSQLKAMGSIAVGAMPQNSCVSGNYVYVLNTNEDSVSVIDTQSDQVFSTFPVNFRQQPFAAAPTACAVDAAYLYVTLANANAIAVLDRVTGAAQGYIPTGWYPTSVIQDQDQLIYVSAKGIQPRRPNPNGQYVLSLLQGSVGVVNKPDIASNLLGWTKQVLGASPLIAPYSPNNPGIQHVFFIVKENRTYDQVLGDLPNANGDASLTQYGSAITPIQHYLASEFVALDNFFCDGEVSTLGHSYTTSAYASPYFEMLTSLEYSGRLTGTSAATPGAFSPSYLWDNLLSQNVDFRVFGEAIYFTSVYNAVAGALGVSNSTVVKMQSNGLKDLPGSASWLELGALLNSFSGRSGSVQSIRDLLADPSFGQPFSQFFTGDDSLFDTLLANPVLLLRVAQLLVHYDFQYHFFDLNYSDLERIAHWLPYFQQKAAAGTLEPFEYLILPNDHTGGSIGLTNDNYLAQNDAALDIFMRALSQTSIWKNSVVFVVEDDAQDGSDHVDATRTTAYVAGPRTQHGVTNSELFDQDSMFRSISWLLGVPPLNMNDALAVPMFSVFAPAGTTPVLTYAPPAVSSSLAASDLTLYQQLLAQVGGSAVK